MAFGCSCVPAIAKIFPGKPSVQSSKEKVSKKTAEEEMNKKQQQHQKKKSNLERAASTTPSLPFHSRAGLL
ncbi:unnamed protein product [Musa acuminata var. zebrina]